MQRNVRPPSLEVPLTRPRLDSRRTFDGSLPGSATVGAFYDTSSPTASRPSPRTPRSPYTACLGRQGKKDFRDWYTLPDTRVVDICPYCVDSKFAKTAYIDKVELRDRSQPDAGVKCCFTSKWHQLAWDVIKKYNEADLRLLASVSRINRDVERDHTDTPCPGSASKPGTWMTLIAKPGEPTVPFNICPVDARKLIKIFPTLKSEFQEVVLREKEVCAMREESHRFQKFADLLVTADDDADRKKRKPDMSPFIRLTHVMSQTPPCKKDNFMRHERWHYSSRAPHLTICAECYATVVWPEIANGSQVAKRIAATEQPIDREHVLGHTCQLWSPRMLAVFRTAVRNNDFKYLADQAENRAIVERNLRLDWLNLDKQQRELEASRLADKDKRLYDLMVARHELAADWKKYE